MKQFHKSAILIALPILFFTNNIFSQNESPINLGFDIYSRYVWRGSDFGSSPSVQPCFEFSKSGLTIGAWGAYTTNINAPAQETDIYLDYTFYKEMLSITLTDYFFPSDGVENEYFVYDKNTAHIFEASLSFNGFENFPLGLLVGTIFYGADYDSNGDNRYSTYCELSYSPEVKGIPISLFCGLNLTPASEDDLNLPSPINGFYGNNLGICNIGISAVKDLKITESFEIPLNLSLITNPMKGNIYLIAGISF
ncbi:MAG TPA: hypothetical protein PKN32_14355 [Bacteroidales bacterium]|nr:hypothetical protein [Bacteroidales bacterium]